MSPTYSRNFIQVLNVIINEIQQNPGTMPAMAEYYLVDDEDDEVLMGGSRFKVTPVDEIVSSQLSTPEQTYIEPLQNRKVSQQCAPNER